MEGFADERGPEAYNLALGLRRAEAMAQALEKLGVSPQQLEVKSLGKQQPADPGHTEKAWSRNRRAKIVVG